MIFNPIFSLAKLPSLVFHRSIQLLPSSGASLRICQNWLRDPAVTNSSWTPVTHKNKSIFLSLAMSVSYTGSGSVPCCLTQRRWQNLHIQHVPVVWKKEHGWVHSISPSLLAGSKHYSPTHSLHCITVAKASHSAEGMYHPIRRTETLITALIIVVPCIYIINN